MLENRDFDIQPVFFRFVFGFEFGNNALKQFKRDRLRLRLLSLFICWLTIVVMGGLINYLLLVFSRLIESDLIMEGVRRKDE